MVNQSATSNTLLIIREAFTSLLPIVLVMNSLVLLSGLASWLADWGLAGTSDLTGATLSRLYFFLLPLFFNLSLSTLLAKEKDLDQIGTILISMVCFFRASGFLGITATAQLTSDRSSILISLPCTWIAVELLSFFSKLPELQRLRDQRDLSPRLRKTLNLILPGLLTILCFEVATHLVENWLDQGGGVVLGRSLPHFSQLGDLQELVLYKVISLLTWFLGIHGEHSADGLFRLLKEIPPGEASGIQLKTFHDVFMNIGGSGSTFMIPLLILVSKRLVQFRAIAQLSLPFSLFNVNEVLLFGLPIILNPVFFIPFTIAPFVNLAIALIVMQTGAFVISPAEIHWMSPPLYSAYIASNGSIAAVMTQLLCLVADGCLYFSFLRFADRQSRLPFSLLKLLGEDAYAFVEEEIQSCEERLFMTRQQAQVNRLTITHQTLQYLRGGRFLLHFQPKFAAQSLQLVGLEALLRFQDARGEIHPPTFLPVFYQHGLSKAIDQKVLTLAFDQILQWRSLGLVVPPISINFDKDFLLNTQAVQTLISRAQLYQIRFCVEITEHTYTTELTALASVVRQLQTAGHYISIDDFGVGYSSLTSLLALEADEIKLDRTLLLAPVEEGDRGYLLLRSSVQLCRDLGFSVVAEGIETLTQLRLAQECGVDYVQGYHLGKPMAADRVCHLFATERVPENRMAIEMWLDSQDLDSGCSD